MFSKICLLGVVIGVMVFGVGCWGLVLVFGVDGGSLGAKLF